ncbi:EpsG family protein, partial [Pseudoalteromonas sp. BSi20429]|uniref:EpsG family protein n=1 Tax=Pseudoalteromonas sp. BSi20429 TaxID=1097676 RepID=UPI0013052212
MLIQLTLFTLAILSAFLASTFSSYFKNSKFEISLLAVFSIVVLVSLTASSRMIGETYSDDLLRYYNSFLEASKHDLFEYLQLNSREFAFQSLNWVLFQIFGDLGIRNFLFIFSFFISTLASIVIYRISPPEYRIICILLCLLTPSYLLFSTQLIRQTLAIFLFFCFATTRGKYKYIYLIFAISMHYVVFTFLLPFLLINRYKKYLFAYKGAVTVILSMFFLYMSVVVAHNYSVIIKLITELPIIGDKALYLLYIDRQATTVGSVFVASILLFYSLFFVIGKEKQQNYEFSNFLVFYFIFISVVFLFFDFKPLS